MAAVLVSSLAFSWAFGYTPFSRKFDPQQFQTETRYAEFIPQLSLIPSDASVSAENGLTSHLSERRYMYDFTFEGVQDAQWVVLDYAGSGRNIEFFNEQVAEVVAKGYQQVGGGFGFALLKKQ